MRKRLSKKEIRLEQFKQHRLGELLNQCKKYGGKVDCVDISWQPIINSLSDTFWDQVFSRVKYNQGLVILQLTAKNPAIELTKFVVENIVKDPMVEAIIIYCENSLVLKELLVALSQPLYMTKDFKAHLPKLTMITTGQLNGTLELEFVKPFRAQITQTTEPQLSQRWKIIGKQIFKVKENSLEIINDYTSW